MLGSDCIVKTMDSYRESRNTISEGVLAEGDLTIHNASVRPGKDTSSWVPGRDRSGFGIWMQRKSCQKYGEPSHRFKYILKQRLFSDFIIIIKQKITYICSYIATSTCIAASTCTYFPVLINTAAGRRGSTISGCCRVMIITSLNFCWVENKCTLMPKTNWLMVIQIGLKIPTLISFLAVLFWPKKIKHIHLMGWEDQSADPPIPCVAAGWRKKKWHGNHTR